MQLIFILVPVKTGLIKILPLLCRHTLQRFYDFRLQPFTAWVNLMSCHMT
jgi:hypothetical protein